MVASVLDGFLYAVYTGELIVEVEDIIISKSPLVCSARNNIEGVIVGMEELPNNYKLTVNVGVPLIVSITKKSVKELDLKLGDTVYCVFKAMAVTVV